MANKVAKNYVILTTNGSVASGDTNITFNEAVPSTGFPFMLVVSTPFEIWEATAYVSTYVLTVSRRQEGTTNTATIASGATVVCEATEETLEYIYDGLLATQKTIGGNETTASRTGRTPDVNEVTVDTDTNKVYVGVAGSPNTWEEFAPESHADLSDLTTSEDHTQYYTDARGDTWHGALSDEHLATLDHDHLTQPAANIRNLAAEPADTVEGGVYYNTTNFTLYYYNGASWQQYNTVPQYAMIFRDDGSCPSGWTEKTAWDGYFLKGDDTATWAGGSGGSSSHIHTLTDVPQHAHTVPDRSITVDAVSNHTHEIDKAYAIPGSGKPLNTSDVRESRSTGSSGDHTHTLTVPEHTTSSVGEASAESQSAASEPKYVQLTLCEKN